MLPAIKPATIKAQAIACEVVILGKATGCGKQSG